MKNVKLGLNPGPHLFLYLVFFFIGMGSALGQTTNCNCYNVTVTLDSDCQFTLASNLVIDGTCPNTSYVRVMDNDQSNGPIVDCAGVWTYGLFTSSATNATVICWGKVTAEDKTAPALVCAPADITLDCYDVNYVLNNRLTIGNVGATSSPAPATTNNQTINNAEGTSTLPNGPCSLPSSVLVADNIKNLGYAYFKDNCYRCGCRVTLKWSDKVTFYSCDDMKTNGGIYAIIFREWVATDCNGMRADYTQKIYFKRPPLSAFVFNGPGGDGYDRVVTYASSTANKSLIKKEDVTPSHCSYFNTSTNPRCLYIDEIECNYSVQIKDTEFPICGGKGVKIDREIHLFDWCTGGIVKTYKVLIKIGDFSNPTLEYKSGAPYIISTGPMDCTANIPVTVAGIQSEFGVSIKDNTSLAAINVSVYTKNRYYRGVLVYEGPEDPMCTPSAAGECNKDNICWDKVEYAVMNQRMIGLPVGKHLIVIDAFDDCYNAVTLCFVFEVKDKIAPVMKCDDNISIPLNGGAYYNLQKSAIDAGSWDNCKLEWLRARRSVPSSCISQLVARGYDSNRDGTLSIADGFDSNADGDINDFGERFEMKNGKLMTPLKDNVEFVTCDNNSVVTIELWGADNSGNTNFCWDELTIGTPSATCNDPAPIPSCINGLSTELMADGNGGGMMAVWASDFVASKIYHCNGQGPETKDGLKLVTKYSINRVGSPVNQSQTGLNLTCADKGKVVLVELHAWDNAGNHDYCVTYIEVQDNRKVCPSSGGTGSISGKIRKEDGTPVPGVKVYLLGGASDSTTTNALGEYTFSNLSAGRDYTVYPQLDKDHLNEVSTFDMVLIQRSILNIQALNSPYKMIAADVDNSKFITTLDLVLLRKLITGINQRFVKNTSWRFVDVAYSFPPTDPWNQNSSPPFPEVININSLNGAITANFVAVKIGDVGSGSMNSTSPALVLDLSDASTPTTGQEVCQSIKATNFNNLIGLETTIQYNATHLNFSSVKNFNLNGLSEASFGLPGVGSNANGNIKLSWNDPNLAGITLANGTALFDVCFIPKVNDVTSTATFNSSTEVVNKDGQLVNFIGQSGDIRVGGTSNTGGFSLQIPNTSIQKGGEFCAQVKVAGFVDIIGLEFSLKFDSTKLTFKEVKNFNLAGLSAGTMGLPGAGNNPTGTLKVSWVDNNFTGVTVVDGTAIFDICFTAANMDATTNLKFVYKEVINKAEQNVPVNNTVAQTVITIGTGGSGGGGSGGTLTLDLTDATAAAANQEVCIKANAVSGFTNLKSTQLSVNYNTTQLSFASVKNFNLTGLTAANFNSATPGTLTMNWNSTTPTAGNTLANGTAVFEVCFTPKLAGISSTVAFVGGAQIQNKDNQVVALNGTSGTITVSGGSGTTGPATFDLTDANGTVGQQACQKVNVTNFTNLLSVEYTITYNSTQLDFVSLKNFNLTGLTDANFSKPGVGSTPLGSIKFSWNDPNVNTGVSVPNGTAIFEVCFSPKINNITSTVTFGGTSEVINKDQQPVTFSGQPGSITVGSGGGGSKAFILDLTDATVPATNQEACIKVNTVSGFTKMIGLEFTISYNTTQLEFSAVKNFNLNGLTEASFGLPGVGTNPAGRIKVSWSDPNVTGITLANGTAIFEVCFKGKITNVASNVTFATTPAPEAIDKDNQQQAFTGQPGTITIGSTSNLPDVKLNVANQSGVVGQDVCVKVSVVDFTNIAALSGTMTYDATALQLKSVTNFNLSGLTQASFTLPGSGGVTPGSLKINWSTATTGGVTVASTTNIFDVCFTPLKTGTSQVTFSSTGLTVTRSSNLPAGTQLSAGTVTITTGATSDLVLTVSNATAQANTDVCLELTARNFKRVIGMQFAIKFDPAFLTHKSFDNLNTSIRGFSTGSLSANNTMGFINLSWVDDQIAGVTLPDNAVIMRMCFQSKTNCGSTLVAIDRTKTIELTDVNEKAIMTQTQAGTINFIYNTAPSLSATLTQNNCYGGTSGAIDAEVVPGSGTYTYRWSNGATTQDLSNLGAGNYSVTVTDACSGLSISKDFVITQPSASITLQSSSIIPADCGGSSTGSISIQATGGTSPYTYSWSNGRTTSSITNLAASTYTYTITDSKGCTLSNNLVVGKGVNTAPSIASPATITNVPCFGELKGAINIEVKAGSGTYTYRWSNGATTQDLSNLGAGNYNVTVTDACSGLTATGTYTISQPSAALRILSITPTAVKCFGESTGAVAVTVSGGTTPYTYSWNNGATTANPSNLPAGVYTLTLSDANGCRVVSSSALVTQPSVALALQNTSITKVSATDAKDGAIRLSVTGGQSPYTYRWNTGATGSQLTQLAKGQYCVTVTDQNQCQATSCYTLESEQGNSLCRSSDSLVLVNLYNTTSAASWTNKWDLRKPINTWYGVKLNAAGCVSELNLQSNNLKGGITASLGNLASLISLNLSFNQLGGTLPRQIANLTKLELLLLNNNKLIGPIPKDWAALTQVKKMYLYNNQLQGIIPAFNFAQSAELHLQNNRLGFAGMVEQVKKGYAKMIYAPQDHFYPDTTFNLKPGESRVLNLGIDSEVSSNMYFWYKNGKQDTTISGYNQRMFQNARRLTTGNYQVNIINPGAPELILYSKTIRIEVPCQVVLNVRIVPNRPTVCAGDTVALSATGGVRYQWSTGQTSSDIRVAVSKNTTFKVTGSDAEGCGEDASFEVKALPRPEVYPQLIDQDCERKLQVDVVGGTAPYRFLWNNGVRSDSLANPAPGIYRVSVTDAQGCTTARSLAVDSTASFGVQAELLQPNCVESTGTIRLKVQGTAPFKIQWLPTNGGEGDTLRQKLPAGKFMAVVQDKRGCIDSLEFEVNKAEGCNEDFVFFNSFTPNDDKVNEYFKILAKTNQLCPSGDLNICYPNNELIIFNRWGDPVLRKEGYRNDWNAGKLPGGAYFYTFYPDKEKRDKVVKGAITVLK